MLGNSLDYRLCVVVEHEEVQPNLRQEHGVVLTGQTSAPRGRIGDPTVLLAETPDIGHGQPARPLVNQDPDQFVEFLRLTIAVISFMVVRPSAVIA